jgi:hypothetical protein
MAVINCNPVSQGFDIHIHMHPFTTKNADPMEVLHINRDIFPVMDCVFKRRTGLLFYQITFYTSGFIVNADSVAPELCTG